MRPGRFVDKQVLCECAELLQVEIEAYGRQRTLLLVALTAVITAALVFLGFSIGYSAQAIGQPSSAEAAVVEPLSEEEALIRVYADVREAVVKIKAVSHGKIDLDHPTATSGDTGSGVVLTPQGHIVTNYHVIEGATDIAVMLVSGDYLRAELVAVDPATDLALIRIEPPASGLQPARLSDSSQLRVGQTALAIGNPFGLQQTLTVGHISALGRQIRSNDKYITKIYDIIQTDATINPGNSGGPLLNIHGEVIGINTAIFSTSRGSQGIGFAVPSNTVEAVVADLLQFGYVRRPFLGITGIELDERLASSLGLGVDHGLLIQEVHPNSGAARAGLRAGSGEKTFVRGRMIRAGGDVLLAIDGQSVKDMNDVARLLHNRQIGNRVTVTILRDGEQLALHVALGEAPPPEK